MSLLTGCQLVFDLRSRDGKETLHAKGDVLPQFIVAMMELPRCIGFQHRGLLNRAFAELASNDSRLHNASSHERALGEARTTRLPVSSKFDDVPVYSSSGRRHCTLVHEVPRLLTAWVFAWIVFPVASAELA
jgi:hypothetical protein